MAEESRMNLAALQQRDPYITEIIDKAVKVTLYKFSQQMSKWSVTDIEGSLFVYRSFNFLPNSDQDEALELKSIDSVSYFHWHCPFQPIEVNATVRFNSVIADQLPLLHLKEDKTKLREEIRFNELPSLS